MTTPSRKKTSALSALDEMSLPQLAPMNWVLTSSALMSKRLARASWTSAICSLSSVSVCARTVLLPTRWTTISLSTTSATVSRTASSVAAGDDTRNSAPPRNSMPRCRCSTSSEAIDTTSSAAETPYQILRWPMKS